MHLLQEKRIRQYILPIMKHPIMSMHGPEHHVMIAAVLVTAYKNMTGKATNEDIKEAIRRGATVPGGYCGLFGAMGRQYQLVLHCLR